MNKKNIVIIVILLLAVLALAYFFINNEANVENNNKLSDVDNQDYKEVETTDEIIGEIDNSLNYFE